MENEIDFTKPDLEEKKIMVNEDNSINEHGEQEEVNLEIRALLSSDTVKRKGNILLLDCEDFLETYTKLYEWFLANPREFLTILKDEIIYKFDKNFTIGLINLDVDEQISNVRVEHVGKIIKFKGIVGKATGIKALIKERKFECQCGTIITIKGSGLPGECSCSFSKFNNSHLIEEVFQDMQEIDVEESQDDIDSNQPQRIRVRLLDELTDKNFKGVVQPGNKIEVIGIVEPILSGKNKSDEEIYEHRIFGLHINSVDEVYEDEINDKDIKMIQELAAREDILELMGVSLAPEIHGQEDVKMSLVLQMLGGSVKYTSNGRAIRNTIHIFLVGDAGVSKTILLRNVQKRMPRAYYVSGEGMTAAGITASVEKDELLGNWGVKAGALPKANGGMAILDELDKADEKAIQSLHTPLESGIVTISKAGINTTLKANCSVLAAANPIGGRFDSEKPLTKQIKMTPTLLSRFDIVHIMRDEVNEEKDSNIVDIIMRGSDDRELISIENFRKYISYAKKLIPKVNPELIPDIKKFYNKVRAQSIREHSNMEGMPITPRHLLGIIRLSEAHAKLRLSETVEQEDLNVAKKLYYEALLKIGMDEDGKLDLARITGGAVVTKKIKRREIIKTMKELREGGKSIIEENELIIIMNRQGMKTDDVIEQLNELKKMAEVFNPRNGQWGLV